MKNRFRRAIIPAFPIDAESVLLVGGSTHLAITTYKGSHLLNPGASALSCKLPAGRRLGTRTRAASRKLAHSSLQTHNNGLIDL